MLKTTIDGRIFAWSRATRLWQAEDGQTMTNDEVNARKWR